MEWVGGEDAELAVGNNELSLHGGQSEHGRVEILDALTIDGGRKI